MTSATKRYATVKRVELKGQSEQWDETCYAYVMPASYADNRATLELKVESLSQKQQIEYQEEFVASHFISGRIKAFDGEKFELTDMTLEDAASSQALSDLLYSEIMGFDLDPKATRKAVIENALQKTDKINTETTSSEGSLQE